MFGPSKTKAGRGGGYFICFGKNCCEARSVALRQHLDGASSTIVANASTARPRACGFSATPSDDLVFIFLRELIDANVIPQPLSNRTTIVRVARSLAPFHLRPESGRDRFSVPGLRNHQIFNIFLSRNILHGQFVAHTTTKEVELRIPNSANYWPLSSTWLPILTYHKVLDTTKSPRTRPNCGGQGPSKARYFGPCQKTTAKDGLLRRGMAPRYSGSRSSLRSEFGCFG